MSRIIIKNLPLYLTEDKLRKHFSQKGTIVTDVKIMKTRDGRSRKFGFVGYKLEQDALEAVKYFDSSFIDTAKLSVELAKTTKDSSLVSTEERHSREREKRQRLDEEAEEQLLLAQQNKKKKQKSANAEDKTGGQEDPQLAEFLSTMKPRQAMKSWANDDLSMGNLNGKATREQEPEPINAIIPENPEDDEYVQLPNQLNENEEEEKFVSLSSYEKKTTDDNDNNGNNDSNDEVNQLAEDDNVSDLQWLQMRRQRMLENKPQNHDQYQDQDQDQTTEKQKDSAIDQSLNYESSTSEPSELEKTIEKIRLTGRLFLRNLLYSSKESDFRELFSSFGELEEVHMPVDPKSGKSKGFAYVLFKSPEDAISAFESLDKTIFQGRLLHILPGEFKKEHHRLDEFDLKNLPLKKQTELKRKAAASKQQFSWNSLYVNSDTVMESAARKLGITKSELINPESSDAAVQQALAETSVLTGIKEYFESKGVDLVSFKTTKEKSDVVILVKNLPFETSLDELTDMFAEYGELRKVLLPPDGGIAMVVFKNAPSARAAFTKLAYRRFKSSILYLEKAPKGLFNEEESGESTTESSLPTPSAINAKVVKPSVSDILGTGDSNQQEGNESASGEGRASLFVKNLNFKTSSNDLHNAFKAIEGYTVAQVKQKPDAKNPGKTLSMGFGFVEFNSVDAANIALKAMDGYILDGHKLQLKISHRGQDQHHQQEKSSSTTSTKPHSKILIKNIPFEANKKDIQKLFGTFGQLRSVRLPKKFNKSARGFAFAEFITAKEAENAMKALQGTHLLGRRLVMEYAQADAENAEQEISRMEAKMRKQVTSETLAGMRLSGKQKNIDLDEGENEGGM